MSRSHDEQMRAQGEPVGEVEPLPVPLMIELRARDMPDHPYLIQVGGPSCTYAELDAEALRWAGAFRALGIRAGDPVAVMLPPSTVNVASWLGLGWLRAHEVPLNTAYKGPILEHVLRSSGARVLVCQPSDVARLDGIDHLIEIVVVVGEIDRSPEGDVRVVTAAAALSAAPAPPRPRALPEPWDVAAIVYTSGTTGPSKGVVMTWAQLHATAVGSPDPYRLDAAPRWYSPFPMFHVSGKQPLAAMPLVGGTVVIRDRFSTADFWDDIEATGSDTTVLVSAMANFLYRQSDSAPRATTLRHVLMLPLIPEVADFERRFGVQVETCYNMSELSTPIRSGLDRFDTQSCGRLRDGYEAQIVDPHDRPVANGEVGELVIRARDPWALMAGYANMPEATVQAWRNLWFHTGDAFRCDKLGNYYFVDRIKDAIRRRGENVSSMEVEQVLNMHGSVLESAVVGVDSDVGEQEILAVVVPKTGESLEPRDLISHCGRLLPHFMVPRFLDIVSDLPRTPTGKIRKAELRTWERPDRFDVRSTADGVSPQPERTS